MRISNWTLDNLIEYLKLLKASDLLDYHCVPMCYGEISFYNGARKDGEREECDILD